jgi:hypothetical protein
MKEKTDGGKLFYDCWFFLEGKGANPEEEWGLYQHATRSGAVYYILLISRSAPPLSGRHSLCLHLEVSRDSENIFL